MKMVMRRTASQRHKPNHRHSYGSGGSLRYYYPPHPVNLRRPYDPFPVIMTYIAILASLVATILGGAMGSNLLHQEKQQKTVTVETSPRFQVVPVVPVEKPEEVK